MTIPSRPAPPPPTQQQQRQSQLSQNVGGFDNTSHQTTIFKLPPPPTTNKSAKLNSKYTKTSSLFSSSTLSSQETSVTSITRKFPPAKTRYGSVQNVVNNDPFEVVSTSSSGNNVENFNVKKKTPPPRPPPPKKDLNYGADRVFKKLGPPQSISKLSSIFGKRKNSNNNTINKYLEKQQQHQQQFPPNKYPPLSTASNIINSNQQIYQSRPYAFVPPLIRNNQESELISFDSPPNSPSALKKFNNDCISVDSFSFSSDSNFSSPNNGSLTTTTQSESGFEDDFAASPLPPSDPWETLINDAFKDNNHITSSQFITQSDFKISQPVRNLNAINNLKGDDILSNGKSLLPPPPTLTMPTIIKPKSTTIIPRKNLAPQPPAFKEEEYDDDDPPMPSCPPPPPPQGYTKTNFNENYESWVNDDNKNDIDASLPAYGIALYDFEGTEEDDLPFKENEKVYILRKLNDNWYFGRNKRGCEGIFPSNYIEVKIPLKEEEEQNEVAACSKIISNNRNTITNQRNQIIGKARCLYNFVAEVPEDLSIKENDIITVLHQINDDWLYGETDNRRGQFPANFVEFL